MQKCIHTIRARGTIKSWCNLLFPLIKIKLPSVPTPLMPHQRRQFHQFSRGAVESFPLFGNANIPSWAARCSHLLCSEAISKWFKFLKEKLLSPTRAGARWEAFPILCPRSTRPGLSSVPGHAHMLMLANASPPSCTQQESVPFGCKCPLEGEGADTPILIWDKFSCSVGDECFCWETCCRCEHLQKGARLYFLLKSISNSIRHSFAVKKPFRFFIQVHLKFSANLGFIPPGAWRGSAKGMKGDLQKMHSFSTFFPQNLKTSGTFSLGVILKWELCFRIQ